MCVTPSVNATAFDIGRILDQIQIPDACTLKCDNKDQDDLFPSGIVDRSCVSECREEKGAVPPSPGVRPSGNNRAFVLLEPMIYEVGSSGSVIKVPAGFVTDYASIPSFLWSLYSPHDQYSRAAIVHDYLYWSQLCSRPQADNLFMIAMRESEVPEITRNNVYRAVTTLGQSSWDDNRRQRESGMPRVVPIERKDFPPNWSWEMYRQYIMQAGIRDPVFSGNDYCALGESTEVPTSARTADITTKSMPPKTVARALRGMDYERFMGGPYWSPR